MIEDLYHALNLGPFCLYDSSVLQCVYSQWPQFGPGMHGVNYFIHQSLLLLESALLKKYVLLKADLTTVAEMVYGISSMVLCVLQIMILGKLSQSTDIYCPSEVMLLDGLRLISIVYCCQRLRRNKSLQVSIFTIISSCGLFLN